MIPVGENLLSPATWLGHVPERYRARRRLLSHEISLGPLRLSLELENVHRPRPWLSVGDGQVLVGLDWGDGSSDPVWSVFADIGRRS